MKTRNFGNEQLQVSEVGLGTWQIGGSWGEVPEGEALAILREAYESGVTFFDTANVYGDGRSEKLISRFLRESGAENVFVATKLGRGANFPHDFSYRTLRAHTEASLERLGVESLALTQLHCLPTEELRRGEVFEALRRLKDEGLIQRFGASVESDEEALICLEQPDLASLQIIFNVFRPKPSWEVFEHAQQQGAAIIIRLPLASGLLSGKMSQDMRFDPSDHRSFNRDGGSFNVGETFAGLPFQLGVAAADAIKPLVPAGMTMAQMALRWILDFPAVTTIIPGASKSSQVRSNVSASELPPLGEALHGKLREIYGSQVKQYIRGPY